MTFDISCWGCRFNVPLVSDESIFILAGGKAVYTFEDRYLPHKIRHAWAHAFPTALPSI
jgi:hypothetical protein